MLKKEIKCILFDVDNTLYSEKCGVEDEMARRITKIVAKRLGISEEEAARQRDLSLSKYGTTLRWLQVEHGLTDYQAYMDLVHPEDLKPFIPQNRALFEFLKALPYRLEILTNGPLFHARRVLETLGISTLFPHIYDINWLNHKGKPYADAFHRCLDDMGLQPHEVLFIDDRFSNVDAFAKEGGHVLFVCADKKTLPDDLQFDYISDILELESYLQKEFTFKD